MANKIIFILFISLLFSACNLSERKSTSIFDINNYLSKDSIKIYQVSDIIDGDTYKVLINNIKFKVRIIGVDTPESSNNYKTRSDSKKEGRDVDEIIKLGKLATNFVHFYLNRGDSIKLELDVQHFDRYNRILAYVYLMDGRMINEILVREGYAQVMTIPPNLKYQELFLSAQRDARDNKRGLWADSVDFFLKLTKIPSKTDQL